MEERTKKTPWWMWTLAAIVIFLAGLLAGFGLGHHAGPVTPTPQILASVPVYDEFGSGWVNSPDAKSWSVEAGGAAKVPGKYCSATTDILAVVKSGTAWTVAEVSKLTYAGNDASLKLNKGDNGITWTVGVTPMPCDSNLDVGQLPDAVHDAVIAACNNNTGCLTADGKQARFAILVHTR